MSVAKMSVGSGRDLEMIANTDSFDMVRIPVRHIASHMSCQTATSQMVCWSAIPAITLPAAIRLICGLERTKTMSAT